MSTKGIIKVKADLSNYNKNRGIVELNKLQNSFTLLIDEECLGHNTTNKQSTLNQVKWLVIKQSVWTNLLKEYSPSQKADLYFFESIKFSESITHIYHGNTASIDIKELDYKITDGGIYLLIPFVNYPEYNKEASIRFVYLAKPKVRYCYFELKELNEFEKEHSNRDFYYYGEPVIIKGSFHLIPDFRLENENVEAYIDIIDNENKSQILDSIKIDIPKYITNASYNLNFSFSIIIKEKWRDLLNHQQNDTKQLALIIRFKFPDNSSKEIKNYNSIIDFEQWRELDAENNIWDNIPMTGSIRIPYENYQVILDRLELSRTNQIAKIGDVNYTIKENNPCGFERIFIKDLADEKRSEFLFFDEQELIVDDQTFKTFDVIRGDNESKNINIRIEGLTNLTGACQHILLDPNESHADIKNLINFDKITPALRVQTNFNEELSLKKYINDNNHTKQDNTKNANKNQQNYEYNKRKDPTILKSGTKNNNYEDSGYEYEKSKTIENDYDLKAGDEKIAGASILGWKEGVDYKRTQTGSTALLELTNIKYKYNKTFDTQFGFNLANDAVDLIWFFNYFFLNHEQNLQTSFIPISTCRYPNQIVRIRLYPDIKWEINFFWNTLDPVWFGRINPSYDIYSTDKEDSRVKDTIDLKDLKTQRDFEAFGDLIDEERDNKREKDSSNKKLATIFNKGFGNMMSEFGISIQTEFNGQSHQLSWGFAEKLRDMLGVLKKVYDLIDGITTAKQARNAKNDLLKTNPAMLGRLNTMSLELKAPAPSLGLSWSYKTINEQVALELKGKVKCSPVIGADLKIDILALASKIPVFSQLVTALDVGTWVLEKISLGNLEIDYKIDLTFFSDLSLEEAFIRYLKFADKSSKLDADLTLTGTFGGKLELSASLMTKVKTTVEIEFDAGIKGECYFEIKLNPNLKLKNCIEIETKFSGLIVTGYIKFSIGRKGSNNSPKSFDPIRLIPKLESEIFEITLDQQIL